MAAVIPLSHATSQLVSLTDSEVKVLRQEASQIAGEKDNLLKFMAQLKEMPDKISHQIMVPFGELAFFPGRLIHTNECKVHLGKSYVSRS